MKKPVYLSIFTFFTVFVVFSILVNLLPVRSSGILYIKQGQSNNSIYNALKDKKIINDKMAFVAYRIITGSVLKAGEFYYNKGDSPAEILNRIDTNKYVYRKFTVPEGLSVLQVVNLLIGNSYLSGTVVINNADMLLPETYNIVRGQKRDVLYNTMRNDFLKMAQPLWNSRTKGLPFTTLNEAVTLASIVEKETGVDGEREKVASVFLNRLKKGMPLQSDPTIIYALSGGLGKLNRPLTRKDWKFKHPFNTYYIKGLPPHPIAGVGIKSLQAVLKPIKTQYYYFVATGKGNHYFAKTLAEHNKNYKKYKATINKQ